MDKKIIIGVIIVILICVGIWMVKKPKVERLPEIKLPEIPKIEKGVAACGWSVKGDEKEAAEEAVLMMKEKLRGSPVFAFLFSSIGYDEEKLLQEIRNLLPGTKIYGGTSCLGPMTNDGFHIGEKASLAIMGISSPLINWGVGGANLDELSPEEAGKKAVLAAIENAGKETTEKAKMVFITAAPGTEERILKGIEEIIGKDVPIFGGSSGDNEIKGEWKQYANDKVYSNGLALAVMYTDLRVGFTYEAGYPMTEQRGTVTKAEGRVIYEINGRPAAKVYNEWTGRAFEAQMKEPGKVWGILAEATFYPIAKVLRTPGREPFYLAVHPLSIRSDYSLEVFAEMKDGDEIVLLHGDWDILLNRFQTTPAKALKEFNIKKGEVIFGLYTYCAGTMLAIPEKERPKMPLLVKEVIGNIPFIGTFTFGEQGFVPDIGNHHGNLVNSIVLVAP
ncbi:MAG: FIST N-terminal domain-containing protein [Patescibacteria group bacterium]|nr:FIST N-terminal domain-containing protein [Patescibacteria group bacterium]